MNCRHDCCCVCVAEARCKEDHLAALGVCDRHIAIAVEYAIVEPGDGTPPPSLDRCRLIVGRVMRMTGGRANPVRVARIVGKALA
jgi:hypothetical protein